MQPPACIILVEDSGVDAYLLEKAVAARGIRYQLLRYEDGERAIHEICENDALTPNLILVDLNLPRREGFEVLLRIRQTPRLVGIPVGVFTSSDAAKDRHRTALLGVEQYIHKPSTLDEFISEVGAAVEGLLALTPRAGACSTAG